MNNPIKELEQVAQLNNERILLSQQLIEQFINIWQEQNLSDTDIINSLLYMLSVLKDLEQYIKNRQKENILDSEIIKKILNFIDKELSFDDFDRQIELDAQSGALDEIKNCLMKK